MADDTADTTIPDSTWIGRVVGGRFRLVEELGAGGIAVVFRAEDVELSRTVAVKILQDAGHGRPELRARFEREAKVLAALSHPNIVSLVDFGVEDGRAYLVMELLRGQTLGELLDREDVLPPERAFHIVRQVVRALAYAHGEGLLHRDLKPDNVFLQALPDTPDHVRLLDFGFAKFVGDDKGGPPLTQAGTVFGTPRYMAPEQLIGGSSVDARADLYAVAVILYEMLSGRRPFEGEVRDVLKAKVTQDPPSLSAIAPDFEVAPELDAFFARALAMRREERFPDAQAFLDALDAIPQPAVRLRAAAPEPPPKKSDRALPIALLLAVPAALLALASVAAALVLWLVWPGDPPRPAARPALAPAEPIRRDEPLVVEDVRDPWATTEIAPVVRHAYDRVVAGEPLDPASLRELREHARQEPDDAHAQLVLGHVFTERGMRAMAIGAYQRAIELDAGARHDPRVLSNLVAMVSQSDEASGAARLIRSVYGADALGAIEMALAEPDLG
ncbi:MAG TPA: protein kinase, partial [Sandaracinaceae bacterium]